MNIGGNLYENFSGFKLPNWLLRFSAVIAAQEVSSPRIYKVFSLWLVYDVSDLLVSYRMWTLTRSCWAFPDLSLRFASFPMILSGSLAPRLPRVRGRPWINLKQIWNKEVRVIYLFTYHLFLYLLSDYPGWWIRNNFVMALLTRNSWKKVGRKDLKVGIH